MARRTTRNSTVVNDINPSFLLQALLPLEFHISSKARKKYEFDETLFASNGNVVFADFRAAQDFANKINARSGPGTEESVKAGQINAAGLLDEILHHVVFLYKQQVNATVFEEALKNLNKNVGQKVVDKSLTAFINEFPPRDVYKGKLSPEGYLRQKTDGVPNRQYALEEMLMLWLTNGNQATSKFEELFNDTSLRRKTAYREVMEALKAFFKTQSGFGPDRLDLISLLRQPALAAPKSLEGQLKFIMTHWNT
ncbi:MAG: hypothetical protein ACE5G1_17500, partial [bacterium]